VDETEKEMEIAENAEIKLIFSSIVISFDVFIGYTFFG